MEIYWDNLFVYVFWVTYGLLCWILWKYSDRMYFWFFSEAVKKDKEGEKEKE